MSGCLLLSERNPENPLQQYNNRIPPKTAREFFEGLKNSIKNRNPNQYISFFSKDEDFRFCPDPETAMRYSHIFENFNYSKEERFIHSLLSRSDIPADSLINVVFIIQSEQLTQYFTEVEISYSMQIDFLNFQPTSVSGRSIFRLVRDNDGGYVAKEWKDFKIGSLPTISEWKATL
ncbi:MAG: hypothetical protein N2450_04175 [bacterium]|nr:hypothetical protein [bacterium]